MVYLLGFIYADGCIYCSARGHYLMITSVDKFIIERAKMWLQSGHTIQAAPSVWLNGKENFRLRIGNKEIYKDLINLGVYPSKSLTIRMPSIPSEFLKDFVRGNFDGDGCVYFHRPPGSQRNFAVGRLSAIFTSGSELFLEDLLEILRGVMSLKQEKIYRCTRAFQLRFGTTDSVEIFKFMYSDTPEELYFSRKYQIFEAYFELRSEYVDKEVQSILDCG